MPTLLLRRHCNRPLVRVLVLLLAGIWLASSLLPACRISVKWLHATTATPCPMESAVHPHVASDPANLPDNCRYQPCMDIPDEVGQRQATQHLDGLSAVFIVAMLWVTLILPFSSSSVQPIPRNRRTRRRVPLFYQYCSLLN
ncbi:MAG TPA: hypothetical protein VNL74_03630 [Methylococcus sp.]|nr:hypothetical protein [Methylococcus sp.]